jgi:hypothetical protein
MWGDYIYKYFFHIIHSCFFLFIFHCVLSDFKKFIFKTFQKVAICAKLLSILVSFVSKYVKMYVFSIEDSWKVNEQRIIFFFFWKGTQNWNPNRNTRMYIMLIYKAGKMIFLEQVFFFQYFWMEWSRFNCFFFLYIYCFNCKHFLLLLLLFKYNY